MGLRKKKQIRYLEESVIVDAKESLKNILGVEIDVNIDWESFETESQLEEIKYQCISRIIGGVSDVAHDDLGKEALAELFSSFCIVNINESSDKTISIDDKTITVKCKWDDFRAGIFTEKEYSKEISSML